LRQLLTQLLTQQHTYSEGVALKE